MDDKRHAHRPAELRSPTPAPALVAVEDHPGPRLDLAQALRDRYERHYRVLVMGAGEAISIP